MADRRWKRQERAVAKTPPLVVCWCPGQGREIRRYAVLDMDAFKEMTPGNLCARSHE